MTVGGSRQLLLPTLVQLPQTVLPANITYGLLQDRTVGTFKIVQQEAARLHL